MQCVPSVRWDWEVISVDGSRYIPGWIVRFKQAGMASQSKIKMSLPVKLRLLAGFAIVLGAWCMAQAQVGVPKYEVDPSWPKPLPGNLVTGRAGGICVDAQDHIFEINRGDLQDKEKLDRKSV